MRFFIAGLLFVHPLSAQDPQHFIDKLKDNSNKQVLTRYDLHAGLNQPDTVALVQLLDAIEKKMSKTSAKIKTRFAAMKARSLFYRLGPGDSLYAAQMKEALYKAFEMDESFMVAEYSRWYGEMLNSLEKRNEAIQYTLNAIVLQEQLSLEYFPDVNTFYFTIGELFYRTRNYNDAVTWLNKGLALPGKDTVMPRNYANALNNLATSYHMLTEFKKSVEVYEQVVDYSNKHQLEDWAMLAFYNRINPFVELRYFDSSKVLLYKKLDLVKNTGDNYTTAGVYFQLGQIANLENDFHTALGYLLKAEEYVGKTGVPYYRTKIFRELSIAYDSLGQPEKSLAYYKEYKHLADSAEKAEATRGSDYLLAKANFEKEQLNFKQLKKQKERGIMLRNTGIIILVVLSGSVILVLNRHRKKAQRMHTEAEKQLQHFRAEMITRNQQIEALLNEMQHQENSREKTIQIEELTRQIILTEDDWQGFQSMFNKAYPGFFYRLKEKAPGITEAEQRLASLIKIQLNTKQISAMQGISSDAVHKTRQRLRQRFNIISTAELEAIITTV